MKIRVLCGLLISLVIASCSGGNNSSPTAPTTTTTATGTRIISIEGSLSFGDVVVGQTKELTVNIRNSGTGPMTLSGITGSGGITTVTSATPTTASIPAGGAVSVVFRFTPTSIGAVSGTVTFTTDHTSGTNTASLTGNGVGVPVTVVGVVTDANTNRPVGGATVRIGTRQGTTDGNGYYSVSGVPSGDTTITVTQTNYNAATDRFTLGTSDTRRDIRIVPFWSMSGVGNTVFDMPTYVSRVRITGRYDSNSSNFIVRIGGRLVVNELLGRAWQATTYNGLHLTSGGVVEITNSRDVTWTFAQEQ